MKKLAETLVEWWIIWVVIIGILIAGALIKKQQQEKSDCTCAIYQQDIDKLRKRCKDLDTRIQNNQNALKYFDEELKSQGYDGYYQYKVVE